MNEEFLGHKLVLARNLRGWTQGQLGEQVGAALATISYIENQRRTPTPDLVRAFSEALQFSPRFFYEPVSDPLLEDQCNFRSRASTAEKIKKKVLAEATLLAMLVGYLKEHVVFPDFTVPNLPARTQDDIERAADHSRRIWGLGLDTPIGSMTRTIESAGVVVFSLDQETEHIDAFSRYGKTPFIVLNTAKRSASRSRFDAAHELGHLVLHRDPPLPEWKDLEAQAHRFAAAFLMPRAVFAAEFNQVFSTYNLNGLLELKSRWGASVGAMIHRAFELDVISALAYRRAYKRLSAMGWRKGEPNEPSPEEPTMVSDALKMLEATEGITPYQAAEALNWAPGTLEKITGVPVVAPPPAGVIRLHPA